MAWEAKSEAVPEGELGVTAVRQAGGHLRYVANQRNEPIPSGSASLLMSPQQRTHPAACAVAEDHVYLVRGAAVVDLFDCLVRVWRVLRSRGGSLRIDDVLTALHSEGALPSEWLPRLTSAPLRQPTERRVAKSMPGGKSKGGPLRPELPAAATILATEHARAAHNPAGWRVAVVVLRYFVAVHPAQTPRA